MRRFAALLLLLLLPACYQVEAETVPASASVRVDGVKDGRYRRPDGVEVKVTWNAAEKLYDVATPDGPTGKARAARLAPGLFLVQYVDAARLTLMAAPKGDDVVLFFATKEAEPRLLKAHGLGLKPGPINALTGPARGVADFFKDLAVSGEFKEGEKLVYLGA
ncbi:hypothetical protein WV31_02335 [Magnetospirillum sp. ME-1]|uniref:hypothetical protein n=1 Tax=Magnetospirillum sp. ME-1 TaxID=1639348 RepID=UPI000A17BF7D|nr:hypothetical protein [Magnetospirillum sp. ME-1]ARJ64595.1 hypothetical protein WV31_02335 [Magnetospirillum sp. ME-1]